MSAFKDMVAADNRDVFLNLDEFGETHELNGLPCPCVVQSPTAKEMFAQKKDYDGYEGISGKTLVVHVEKDSLEEVPREGQIFELDGVAMIVADCVEDMGMLSITLHQNVGAVEV